MKTEKAQVNPPQAKELAQEQQIANQLTAKEIDMIQEDNEKQWQILHEMLLNLSKGSNNE